jgi:hypothetical protein
VLYGYGIGSPGVTGVTGVSSFEHERKTVNRRRACKNFTVLTKIVIVQLISFGGLKIAVIFDTKITKTTRLVFQNYNIVREYYNFNC